MVKRKIGVMLVALMVTFAIPTMAFATDEAVATPSCGGLTHNVSAEAGESNNLEKNTVGPEKSAVEAPTVEVPVTKQPVVEKPVAEPPITDTTVVEQPVVEKPVMEQPATEKPVVDTPAVNVSKPATGTPVEIPAVVDKTVTEQPVTETPAVETLAIEQPVTELPKEESTLVIHHLFQQGDVVCDDYETVDKLTVGDKVTFQKYSYENKYEFVKCLNGNDSIDLQAGTNNITIKYTLKKGFKLV
ncbi:hypothetical protein [Aminipila terrae]|uniref:Uncharacterized protein n=1 Tax=Aminipila terrae TaxID=2697030 RepID=A0A6P1MKP9_9FIRM|nr:hypothetical protein [Aminipila terrae]QHI73723.1 hypothetical protein Ami3637_16260 [Aminipila terrae]